MANTAYDGQFIADYEYQEGNGDLDECNGMTIDGQYGYYATEDHPYLVSCYSGEPSSEFGADQQIGQGNAAQNSQPRSGN